MGTVTLMAGVYGAYGIVDAVGTTARFGQLRCVALNHDETILYIGDQLNCRLRQLVISSLRATTAAGTGVASSVNGPRLSSTFVGPSQAKWYCNRLTSICGLMVADSATGGAIRWVPFTPASISMSASAPTNEMSKTLSILATTTMSSPRTPSPTTTQQFSNTPTLVHTPSLSSFHSSTATTSRVLSMSKTLLLSPDLTLSRSLSMRSQTADISPQAAHAVFLCTAKLYTYQPQLPQAVQPAAVSPRR